jgi:hypothetical protein
MRRNAYPIFIICAGKTGNWNVLIAIALMWVHGVTTIDVLVLSVICAKTVKELSTT